MKILILFCGGTIVMNESSRGPLRLTSNTDALESLLSLVPKVDKLASVDVEFIANVDSSNMTPSLWIELAKTIKTQYENYEGFVITHGTDTMAYSAAALSFLLQDIGKPVIFTGSQIPGFNIHSDARINLVYALQSALMNLSGVYLLFHNELFIGSRVTKVSESSLQAFDSVCSLPLATFGVDTDFHQNSPKRLDTPCNIYGTFEKNIAVLTLFPGISSNILEVLIQGGVKGIVLRAFGAGNIPSSLKEGFEKARSKQIPVVVATQCRDGETKMSLYDAGQKALDKGAIEAFDMSLEVCVVKLMWILGQKIPYANIPSVMHTSIVGEIRSVSQP
jgi:L-asparaginase